MTESQKIYQARIYQKNPDVVFRIIAGEAILVPVSREAQAVGELFTLNEVGAFIWERLDGRRKLGEILEEILAEYEVSRAQADKDLRELIASLSELKAIRQD